MATKRERKYFHFSMFVCLFIHFICASCFWNPKWVLEMVICTFWNLINLIRIWNFLLIFYFRTVDEKIAEAFDYLSVLFGMEILKIVPGRVSIEVDARLSFDTKTSIDKALKFIAMFEELGIDRNRILIKLASTWEGIQAAKWVLYNLDFFWFALIENFIVIHFQRSG